MIDVLERVDDFALLREDPAHLALDAILLLENLAPSPPLQPRLHGARRGIRPENPRGSGDPGLAQPRDRLERNIRGYANLYSISADPPAASCLPSVLV